MPVFRHRRTGRTVTPQTDAEAQRYYDDEKRWSVEGGEAPAQTASDTEVEVPDGTVADVLEWAGDDPDRRNAALEAEEAGKRRKGVLDALS